MNTAYITGSVTALLVIIKCCPCWEAPIHNTMGKDENDMAAKVDVEKCTACGNCAEVCPVDAIKVSEKAAIDPDTCVDCGTCVDECPEAAISMED